MCQYNRFLRKNLSLLMNFTRWMYPAESQMQAGLYSACSAEEGRKPAEWTLKQSSCFITEPKNCTVSAFIYKNDAKRSLQLMLSWGVSKSSKWTSVLLHFERIYLLTRSGNSFLTFSCAQISTTDDACPSWFKTSVGILMMKSCGLLLSWALSMSGSLDNGVNPNLIL